MDRLTKEQRSRVMSHVRPKGSKIEMRLRRALWARGLRYRLHAKQLPGTPDIVFTRAKVAIFVDSEFWHGHDWERRKADFKSNTDFWYAKIERNIQRDHDVNSQLEQAGWIILRFWGKEVENRIEECIDKIQNVVESRLECIT
jgi:DNA mismatch endonuclease, patch repair protein